MKTETYEQKMAELFGISTEVVEKVKVQRNQLEAKRSGKIQGISEFEIQKFREMQAVIYFLQAPQLFHLKVCPRCEQPFMVSRLFVGFCSYDCIREQIRDELGTNWEKSRDLEALAVDPHVWNGNEPLWIRNLPRLKEILEQLVVFQENDQLKNPTDQSLGKFWESQADLEDTKSQSTSETDVLARLQQAAGSGKSTTTAKPKVKKKFSIT